MTTDDLKIVAPESLGLCPVRWTRILERADALCQNKRLPALSIQIQRRGQTTGTHHFGSAQLDAPSPVKDETRFLVASLTKPMLAMATLVLVENGELTLNQPVHQFFPEMTDPAKRPMTIRHLLTHTSGLPDMLPDNQQLRQANAPLEVFVEKSCRTELLFPPGRSSQYQSMGFALLGAILEKITGLSCREFLQRELFTPLGMSNTSLGLSSDSRSHEGIAEVEVPESQRGGHDWNWNSRYWRELGAPWGGAFSTVADLSKFLRLVAKPAHSPGSIGLLSASSVQNALENRLDDFPSVPDAERRTRGWGLGWRLNWKDHRSTFSDLLPLHVAGHWGATGTLFWVDRSREIGAVLLSTCPSETPSPLTHLSNMIAAAFID